MRATDKAKELVEKFKPHAYNGAEEEDDNRMQLHHAKKCALIVVDEILKLDVPVIHGQDSTPWWEGIKKEIEKL